MGRVIVVIAEGAAPSLLERWGSGGVLPSFQAVRDNGVFGRLRSLDVPYELPALTSAFTGVSPGEHGCYSMWGVHQDLFSGIPQTIASTDICSPYLWHLPSFRSRRVSIVNVMGTHPPSPVNGRIITYPFRSTLHACYPPDLIRELSEDGFSYAHDTAAFFSGTPKWEFVSLVERIEDLRKHVCVELLRQVADLFVFNLTVIDRVSHFWWREIEPDSGVDEKDTALWAAYKCIDQFLETLLEVLLPDDHLLLFSEIGFGPLGGYVSVNDMLVEAGMLTVEDGMPVGAKSIAMESVQGSQGVNLNFSRRYRDGIISECDEERYLKEVIGMLRETRLPGTLQPLFRDVVPSSVVYSGKRVDLAPDLILIPYDEEYLPLGHPYWAKHVSRRLQTGWHRRDTFWSGLGCKFGSSRLGREASCLDIAPTILDLLDEDTSGFEGRSLVGSSLG